MPVQLEAPENDPAKTEGKERKELQLGMKTFFIVPELTVMPEDFLLSFFLRGYETYYLTDDPYLSLKAKIKVLFSLFPELILFFNLDKRINGISWPAMIKDIQEEYRDRAMLGVLYRKQANPEIQKKLERQYLYDIGIICGCIPMEYQKAKNQRLLEGVLEANKANGRRKSLRAICACACRLNLVKSGARFEGRVSDVSISHFSCEFLGREPDLKPFEKVKDVQLNLSGAICTVDAVLYTKRVANDRAIYVFVFRNSRDHDGLDPETLSKVNKFVFTQFQEKVGTLVKSGFDIERAKALRGSRQNPRPLENRAPSTSQGLSSAP